MLSKTKIQAIIPRYGILRRFILATPLLFSLADAAEAIPSQPLPDNAAEWKVEGGKWEVGSGGRGTTFMDSGEGSFILADLKGDRPAESSGAASEKTNLPMSVEEWRARLPKASAQDLLPPATFLGPENLRVQASPPQSTEPSADPSISPELQQLRQQFLIEEPTTATAASTQFVVAPGASISTPIAFGAGFLQLYGGFGFQSRTRYTSDADGGLSVGIGLGDPQKIVGLDVTMAVLSLFGDDAFERGAFSFKVHRSLPEGFAVAVGYENAINWGDTDGGNSVYGVVSKFFQLKNSTEEPFSQLTLSFGLGGGRFRSESDIFDEENTVGVFGSAGVRLLEPISFILEWTGQDLNTGISLIPFRNIPLTVNLAGADLTNNAGDGARFIMSIGYNYFFPR